MHLAIHNSIVVAKIRYLNWTIRLHAISMIMVVSHLILWIVDSENLVANLSEATVHTY